MADIRVLVVDDQENIAKGLADYLNRQRGFHASAQYSGKEGIVAIERQIKENQAYDVVVCDLLMPDPDGLEVLKQALFLDRYLCFIMLTGYGSIDSAVKAMDAGAYHYIEKPFDRNIGDNISLIRRGAAERTIRKIRHEVLETQNESHVMDLIDNALDTLFAFREYFLAVIKNTEGEFEVIRSKGNFSEKDLPQRGFVRDSLKHKKRIIEPNIDNATKSRLNPLLFETKSLLVEPLIVHDELLGILELESNRPNAFSFFDQKIIAELADAAALALNSSKILRDRLREQQEIVSHISHLLKTPLWNIIGRIELLNKVHREELPSGVEAYIQELLENGKKAERLVRETLTGYTDKEKEVEIGEIIDALRSDYYDPEIAAKFVWPEDHDTLKRKLACKPRQIEIVLRNVINNALDAIRDLGDKGHVRVGVKIDEKRNNLDIEVVDNGPGMPEEIRDKLFIQPFVTTKEMEGGTGLGLFWCRKIIGEHEGNTTLDSSNRGTKISISLPLGPQKNE